ncbi:MAG: hemolysin family protein [Dehalococcoidia bacterium]
MELSILMLVLALIGSAFISSSETALLAVNKFRIHRLATEGDRRARMIMKFSEQHEKFFGAILLANNVLNMMLAAVGTSLAIAVWGNTGGTVALATIATTAVLVIFGELTPKSLANVAAERWSLFVARPVYFLMIISGPLVYGFTILPKVIMRLLGGREALTTPAVTIRELRMLIDIGEAEGTVETGQGAMLENIFRFGETEVRDVMTPRTEITWVNAETTFEQFLESYRQHPHTRFPVYDDDFDDVVGVLSVKDVMASFAQGKLDPSQPVTRLMRRALFVPETKRLDELFSQMQQAGHKIALAVDEFGGISGLITLTRVVEQIVGRTGEEGSVPERRFITVDENTFLVDGGMTIDEANDELDLEIPEGDYETVAGFFLEQAQKLPEVNSRIRFGELRMQVVEMDDRKISKIRIRRRPKVAEGAQPQAQS